MGFTPGNFDIVAQIETSALDVLTDIILKTLEKDNKTKFSHQIGSGSWAFTINIELTDISIPAVKTLNLAKRFKKGNTLASFEVEAELVFSLLGANLKDTLAVRLKDLQIGIFTTPGGLPVGVALGFQEIDLDVRGLGFLNSLLNTLVDFIALGIRTALSPLGMVPIPILQFADAFAQIGLTFDRSKTSSTADGSPYIGIARSQTGLYLAADFQAANNKTGNISVVQDILALNMNTGMVISDRLINQTIETMLLTDRFGLVKSIAGGGINFAVGEVKVRYQKPTIKPARIGIDAFAHARVKAKKGGFFGKLFGKTKKVTIRVSATMELDTGIMQNPATQLSVLDFAYDVDVQGKVSVNSVLASVMTIVLGPFLVSFLFILSQLLNYAIEFFLPEKFKFNISGSLLTITIDKLTTQLGAGASLGMGGLSSATLSARIEANGSGVFELEHFTVHKFASAGIPLKIDYSPQSLKTRDGEMFLGAGLSIK